MFNYYLITEINNLWCNLYYKLIKAINWLDNNYNTNQ